MIDEMITTENYLDELTKITIDQTKSLPESEIKIALMFILETVIVTRTAILNAEERLEKLIAEATRQI
jgi:hypothetical protein